MLSTWRAGTMVQLIQLTLSQKGTWIKTQNVAPEFGLNRVIENVGLHSGALYILSLIKTAFKKCRAIF